MALAYYGARISPHMTKTPEGYLICHDVPINRIGEQEYFARELELPGDPEKVVTVYRHPEDVFSLETLASFEGKFNAGKFFGIFKRPYRKCETVRGSNPGRFAYQGRISDIRHPKRGS